MDSKKTWGVFCEIFDSTARNRVLEIFLEGPEVDNSLGNIAEESGLSRAAVYNVIGGLLEQGLIAPSRKIGRTQLYRLNPNKDEVRVLVKAFNLALGVVAKEVERGMMKRAEKTVIR